MTVERILGSRLVCGIATLAAQSRLRVLAFHGVGDAGRFEQNLRHLKRRWNPVGVDDVESALEGARPLPPRSVWLTFDDGLRSTMETGLTVLRAAGVHATAFVNPGLIVERRPHWWRVIEEARGSRAVYGLKRLPDPERRAEVRRAEALVGRRKLSDLADELADEQGLRRWRDAGMSIGNHTWDHPCLERCPEPDQQRQIDDAEAWLEDAGLSNRRIFAYPDGGWTAASEQHLYRRGYLLAARFDHRLARMRVPLRLSRLRVDASAEIHRFRAIVSGAHPAAFGLVRRFRRATR